MPNPRITERTDLLSSERASHIYGVSRVQILNYIIGGRLAAERIGNRYFVYRLEVEQLARERVAKTIG